MRLGYARVSTKEQNLAMQLAALKEAGCSRTFTDKVSGTAEPDVRSGLAMLLGHLRPGDQVLVWKMERLTRSLPLTLDLISPIHDCGATFASISPEEGLFNTSGSQVETVFHGMTAIAQYEREIIHRRTAAGIEHAKVLGVRFGRPSALNGRERRTIRYTVTSGSRPMVDAARMLKVSKLGTTIRLHLSHPHDRLRSPKLAS